MPKRPDRLPSQKQYDFIKRLVAERELEPGWAEEVERHRLNAMNGWMSSQDASDLITALLSMPKKQSEQSDGAAGGGDPEPGVYVHETNLYKVQEGRESGRRYAKVWNTGTKEWDYHGRNDPFRFLTEGHRITAEQAAEFGHAVGMCVFCGRTLTDPRSVEVGYGPVCADYHSLPWGEGPAAAGKGRKEGGVTCLCDGTGWTGDPKVRCVEHYDPNPALFEMGHDE